MQQEVPIRLSSTESPQTKGTYVVGEIKQIIEKGPKDDLRLLNTRITNQEQAFATAYEKQIRERDTTAWEKTQQELTTWVKSERGRRTLLELTQNCAELVADVSHNGPPGHDTAHLLKDLYSALIAIREERLQDSWLIATFIPSLMHDFGKKLEYRIHGHHISGVEATDHANISSYYLNKLLEQYPEIPQALKDQMRYAVLVHTKGTSEETMAQLVQRADREQLVGAEGVRRMFIADAALGTAKVKTKHNPQRKTQLPLPGKSDDTDLFHHIEFYMRNLYPNIGKNGENRASTLKAESGIFLWLASTDSIRQQIFAPELEAYEGQKIIAENEKGEVKFKKPLLESIWKLIQQRAEEEGRIAMELYGDLSLSELLSRFIGRKNTNLEWEENGRKKNVIADLTTQANALSRAEQERLRIGLAFALRKINAQEDDMRVTSWKMYENPNSSPLEKHMAKLILQRYANG